VSIGAVCASVSFIYRRHESVFARKLTPANDLLHWDGTSRDEPALRLLCDGLDQWFLWYSSVTSLLKITKCRGFTHICVCCQCPIIQEIYDRKNYHKFIKFLR
jgi:hypothetical protein